MGGKALGINIGLFVPKEIVERLDSAVKATKSKGRSELIRHILINWLDNNGF